MKLTITFIMTVLFSLSGSFAAEAKMTKEKREKMAETHEKMATCLKSDKKMSECHKEMRSQCKSMMGEKGCPMMDGKMMGKMSGMMKDGECNMMSE